MRDSVIRPWVSRLAWASAALVALGSVVALVAAGGLMESTPLLDRALVVVAAASAALVVIVPLRSRMLRRQAVEIARQEAILQAAAFAAERFLKTRSWSRDLPEVLAQLGRAADASRVHVYENERGPGDELLMSQLAEWTAPGVVSYLDDPANQRYPYRGTGFESWEEILGAGEVFQGRAADLPEPIKLDLQLEQVASIAVVPIFAGDDWWGYLGLDECRRERTWSQSELDALRAAADTLGAAIGRERAERRLSEAQQSYRTLVEQLPLVTYIEDVEDPNTATYVSPQIEGLTGYTAEEWRADPELWYRLLHPEDRVRAIAEDDRTTATGDPVSMEYRFIARDGRVVWVRDEAALLRDDQGHPIAWHGFYEDITAGKEAEDALREAEAKFRTLVEAIPAITYIDVASDTNNSPTLYISPQVKPILGYSPEEWVADPELWMSSLHPDDREGVLEADRTSIANSSRLSLEYRLIARDGRIVWIQDESAIVTDEDGVPRFEQGVMLDITARKEAEEQLRDAERRFRVLVEQAPAVVYIDSLNDVASAMYMSPQIEALVGYTVEEWRSDPDLWVKRLHPDDVERALELNARHNETGEPFRMEYRLIARDGHVVWVRDEAVMIRAADGTFLHSQGLMQDITEAKAAEEQIEFLAYHDGLTGLPNQTMFTQLVDLALARAHRSDLALAVLSLDVDGFKLANDTLGTEGGDRLLQQIAERLAPTIRETDTLARRGGDDFLILLADLERGEVGELQAPLLFAESVADRIRETLAGPFDIEGTEVFVSASVGISVHPDDAANVEELLVHAETAMLSSKRSGPGGFAVCDVGVVDSATKFAFVTRLRKAADRKEWVLHYQPIVELATGAIQGVEALIRWQTEDGEMIPPNEFIPLAEELGLIETIGDWVVEEIVRQDHAWRAEGLRLEMGFNLSPREFGQPDLVERILSRLDELGTDPTNVVVEITEGTAMRDPDRAKVILWDLHSRGLRLALDDFGTGYSSLSRLRTLPIDVLKIDRSFVSRVDEDPQAAKIVAAFIQLGQGLGMMTLAEGIETEGEWRFLVEQGCELGQGFYFSRPVPADVISSRFRAGELILAGTR